MWKKTLLSFAVLMTCGFTVVVCDPSADETAQVTLPVKATGSGLETVTNTEGWEVTLSEFKLAISDIEFTIGGETHASNESGLSRMLAPFAFAHPGHYAGGEVTGELLGNFVLDLMENSQALGDGTLLALDYNGVNLHFRVADESDDIAGDDPLLGHSAYIEGIATKEDVEISFVAMVDVEEGTEMVGAPFNVTLNEESEGTIELEVVTLDPSEGDTLFDGLDFGALDEDGDGSVLIESGDSAHNIFMKTLITHDHYSANFQSE